MSFHLEGYSALANATPLKICGSNDPLPEEELPDVFLRDKIFMPSLIAVG
jgi:hypothetical protein